MAPQIVLNGVFQFETFNRNSINSATVSLAVDLSIIY